MIRTRAIIAKLSYDDLVKQGIIPDLLPLINQSQSTIATKRYPPFVYKAKDFASFGMLFDYIIRAGLRINLKQNVELGPDPNSNYIQNLPDKEMLEMLSCLNRYETSTNMNEIANSSLVLTSTICGRESYTKEEIQRYVPTIVNVIKEIIAKWNALGGFLNGTVKFNTEFSHKRMGADSSINAYYQYTLNYIGFPFYY